MNSRGENACSTGGSCCRLPLLLGFVLAAILILRMLGPREHEIEQSAGRASGGMANSANASEKVSLAIDFGDGRRQEFAPLPWHEGMTVADLLHAAPGVSITQSGTGDMAFLSGINDQENEGAEGLNWLFEVNGRFGDCSYAAQELRPGDQVLWTFRPRR